MNFSEEYIDEPEEKHWIVKVSNQIKVRGRLLNPKKRKKEKNKLI